MVFVVVIGCFVFFFNWYFSYPIFHLYVWRNGSFGHTVMGVLFASLNVVETSGEN